MFWRTLRLVCACGVLAVSAAPACGGNASDSKPAAAGGSGARAGSGNGGNGSLPRAGSAGMPTEPTTVACGTQSCAGVQIPIEGFSPIPACCADAKTSHCGLDTSALSMYGAMFSEACQPLAQPGTPDATCPSSPSTSAGDTGLAISLPGCCRPNHTCGYELDKVLGIFQVGLGCVASEPFLDGEAPQPCGEAAAGAAGSGGDSGGGAGGESSAAGGESSAAGGGAGGDSGNGG